ncbi:MAG: aminopeptidase P family protein [Mycoplasmatales bacterium]|nr:aminopeptidase P family protein [Mycoplasmatales bacterium]
MKKIDWKKINADAILLANPKNIRHFSGLAATFGFVIIDKEKVVLFADGRYFEIASKTSFADEVILLKGIDDVKSHLEKYSSVAIEGDYVTLEMKKQFSKLHNNLVEINGQSLRMVKSDSDIESLKKATSITKKVMKWISEQLKPGMTEIEVSILIETELRRLGSEPFDYMPIVSSGPNSALPHHHPSNRVMQEGETVMFDFAAVVDGFTADITRNYSVGELKDPEIKKIKEIVRKSQEAGIAAVKPGVTGKEIDEICRKVIEEAGYGDKFIHSTGHGLGRDVHELPNVSKFSITKFEPGHVITVEPGIYLPGIGGIRIEDDILVTENGYEIL